MDPKQQLNQLDPKLKEAYERVMGTPVGANPAQAAQAASQQPSAPIPANAQPMPANPFAPAGHIVQMPQPAPAPQMQPQQPMQQPVIPVTQGENSHVQPAATINPFGATPQPTAPATPAHPTNATPAKPGSASHGFVAGKKGLHMSPLILIVGGIIFLLVYTVFWLKFFNIPLPFLSQ